MFLRRATTPCVVSGTPRLAVAELQFPGFDIFFFRALLVTLTIPPPDIFCGLFAVDPDVAENLAAAALQKRQKPSILMV
jgi:hypothetical protein